MRCFPLLGALLVACGGTAPIVDAGLDGGPLTTDAGIRDAGRADAGSDAGAVRLDGGADAGPDAGLDCAYLDLNDFIADCSGRYTRLREWTATASGVTAEQCPPYWTIEGRTGQLPSAEAALSGSSCDPDCLRGASTSFSILRCDRRSGYIQYEDREGDCEAAIDTPDGIFDSVESWNLAAPCP